MKGKKLHQKLLARLIASLLFLSVVAGTWDAWWHGAIGRETFFEAPHILLYSSVLLAIILGIYGWRSFRDTSWKRLAIALSFIIIAAPFDELWHRIFGVEDLVSPFVVWSPPHLAIIFATVASIIIILPIIKRDSKDFQILFGGMLFAALLSLLLFLVSPLQPEGPWHLFGYFGSGIITFVLVSVFMYSEKWIPFKGGAIISAAFFISLSAISFNEKIVEGVRVLPHAHPPSFLIIFSVFLLACVISLFNGKRRLLTGVLSGFLWAILIYGFSWMFFDIEFMYTFFEGMVAVIFGAVGGLIGGVMVERLEK